MTNKHSLFYTLIVFIALLTIQSCKPEDDTVNPVIILKGDLMHGINPYNFDSIGGSFIEPGYTAVDDVDGDITGRVVVQYPVIAKDSAKSYQAFYMVKDNAGNMFTTYRVINIKNTTAFLEGIYNNDTLICGTDSAIIYQSIITSSSAINGDFSINNFANKGPQALLNGHWTNSGNLTFTTPVDLLDSDSTVVLNIQSGNLTITAPTRLDLVFYVKNDTIPDSLQCTLKMAR